jgi:hypothetical protein
MENKRFSKEQLLWVVLDHTSYPHWETHLLCNDQREDDTMSDKGNKDRTQYRIRAVNIMTIMNLCVPNCGNRWTFL